MTKSEIIMRGRYHQTTPSVYLLNITHSENIFFFMEEENFRRNGLLQLSFWSFELYQKSKEKSIIVT